MATLVLPLARAKSKAALAIRRVPASVVTLKSMLSIPGTSTPRLPRAYSPSVFSRKKVQSMPSFGTDTGRTLANRSSSRRMATLALSSVPPLGVSVGPFNSTSQSLMAASTSSGMAFPWAVRFSMVSPSMSRSSTRPLAISSASSFSNTRRAWAMRMGPMPSPGIRPMTMRSIREKSLAGEPWAIRSCRFNCSVSKVRKCAAAWSIYAF